VVREEAAAPLTVGQCAAASGGHEKSICDPRDPPRQPLIGRPALIGRLSAIYGFCPVCHLDTRYCRDNFDRTLRYL